MKTVLSCDVEATGVDEWELDRYFGAVMVQRGLREGEMEGSWGLVRGQIGTTPFRHDGATIS